MTGMSTTYDTGRPSGLCAATGRRLEVGERFVACLVEPKEGSGLVRVDYGLEAWEAGARPAAPARVFGFWRAVVAAPGAKKKQLVDDASLLDLFEQLAGATEGRKVAFRYLLALVLVRKRLLVIEGAKGGTMLVRHKGAALPPERGGVGPPLLEVIDPGLDPQALEEGTEELAAILLSDAAPGAGR